RWKRSETIGPLIDRPGTQGDWCYYDPDRMGPLEWLEFCEDLRGVTLLVVYAG
ncbi:glycoside hydrolase family 51 protein, partial [Lepidopterella palustris CBS 459.81]